MKAEFIIPFIEAATAVGEQIMGAHPSRGELSMNYELVTTEPINILCGVSGAIEGIALFGLSRETAMKIGERMLDTKLRVLDQTVSGAILEFGEKLEKAFSPRLSKLGYAFELIPVALVRGMYLPVPTLGSPILGVPLHFEGFGAITVHVSLDIAAEKDTTGDAFLGEQDAA